MFEQLMQYDNIGLFCSSLATSPLFSAEAVQFSNSNGQFQVWRQILYSLMRFLPKLH